MILAAARRASVVAAIAPTVHRASLVAALAPTLLHAAGPAEAELERHRDLWAESGIDAYEYGYQKYCDCNRDAPPVIVVTVDGGDVTNVRLQPHGFDHYIEADAENFEYYWTIEGLFDLLASALDTDAVVRADYDPDLGYPRNLYVDYDAQRIGDEVDLRLTGLEPTTAR